MKGLRGTTEVKLRFIEDADYVKSLLSQHTPESTYDFHFDGRSETGMRLLEIVPYRDEGYVIRFGRTDYHGYGQVRKLDPLEFSILPKAENQSTVQVGEC